MTYLNNAILERSEFRDQRAIPPVAVIEFTKWIRHRRHACVSDAINNRKNSNAALKNAAPAAGYRRPGHSQGPRASIHFRWNAWCQHANASGLGAKAPEANGPGSGFVVDDPPQPDGIFRCDRRVECAIDTSATHASRPIALLER